RRDPGPRVVGDPVDGPPLERDEEGIGDGLLGEVEVADHADQRREGPAVLLPERPGDRLPGAIVGVGVVPRQVLRHMDPAVSQIGRTSTLPWAAAGSLAAASIAASRSAASMRKYPPRCSLVSANGPSVTTRRPSTSWTVVASVTGLSASPPRSWPVSRSHV